MLSVFHTQFVRPLQAVQNFLSLNIYTLEMFGHGEIFSIPIQPDLPRMHACNAEYTFQFVMRHGIYILWSISQCYLIYHIVEATLRAAAAPI